MAIVLDGIKGAKEPITLQAPVIVDARDPAQANEILEFIDVLTWSRATDVAAAEAKRLAASGYFYALSAYARGKGRIPGSDESLKGPKHKTVQSAKAASPKNLEKMFNDTAALMASALISEVVIIPSNVYKENKTVSAFHRSKYDQAYYTAYGVFSFGFYQAYSKDRQQSTTFATFTVDTNALEPLLPLGTQKMFKDLQAVMTLVNHDMLHHLTSPILNQDVAHKKDGWRSDLPINKWHNKVIDYAKWGDTEAYEDWAQITHERVVLAGDPEGKKTAAHIAGYFDELTRLRDAALAKAESPEQKDAVREAVNYCALLMGHALTRVYPLNHPVMARCLDRMTAVDMQPEKSLQDALFTASGSGRDQRSRAIDLAAASSDQGKINQVLFRCQASADILSYYGFVVPKLGEAHVDMSPRLLKLMQLTHVSMVDVHSHVPGSKRKNISGLRKDGVKLTLGMIDSMDKTLKKLKPKKPS